MYSTDAINWTVTTSPGGGWQDVTYGDGKFVAVARDTTNRVMYSTDGINWTAVNSGVDNHYGITYGDGKFVAVGNTGDSRVIYSTNAINWSVATAPERNDWWSVIYGNGKFVAVAYNGEGTNRIMYSSNGINWTKATAPENNRWYSVTYGDGKFVAVATNGTNNVMYSTDGINWTATKAAGSALQSVTYGDGMFVAVATGNRVMYSLDGTVWDGDLPELTFASDKDIENFRRGDVVQSPDVKVVSTNKAASQITVDGGTWKTDNMFDQSQVWSNNVSINGSGTFLDGQGPTGAFDGGFGGDNRATYTGATGRGNYAKWVPDSGYTNVNLRVFYLCGNSGPTFIALDNTYYSQSTAIVNQWVDFGNVSFSEIRWGNDDGTSDRNGANVYAIEINGKILVDTGVEPPGDTNLSAGPFVGTGEYVSHTANTLELTNAAGRWCADNQNVGLSAVSDAEYTDLGVDPDNARFTSANGVPLTPEFSGELTNFESRIWSIASSADGNTYGAFTDYTDTSVASTQTGATEWQPPGGTLVNDTYYKAKVAYTATGAANVESAEISI